jgi:drug/metabolite transporter (DMT)-like permease
LNLLRAAAWMLLGIFALSAVAVAGWEVSSDLDTFEFMLYRSLLGIPVVWALARWRGEALRTARLPLHFLRNVFHFTAQNLWFYALALIPLAQVFALEFTTPIWVVLLVPLALREPLTRMGLIAVALGFVGILVIVRPGVYPWSSLKGQRSSRPLALRAPCSAPSCCRPWKTPIASCST